jgi:hypothetical protein
VKTSKQTPVIDVNYNPEWNHTLVCDNVELDTSNNKTVNLSLWDWDKHSSHDFVWESTITKQILPQMNRTVEVCQKGHEDKSEPGRLYYSLGIFPSIEYLQHRVHDVSFVEKNMVSEPSVTKLGLQDRCISFTVLSGRVHVLITYKMIFDQKQNRGAPYMLPSITLFTSEDWIIRFGRNNVQSVTNFLTPKEFPALKGKVTNEVRLLAADLPYKCVSVLEDIRVGQYTEALGVTLDQVLRTGEKVSNYQIRFKTSYGLIKVRINPPHNPKFLYVISEEYLVDIVRPGQELTRIVKPARLSDTDEDASTLKVCLENQKDMNTDFRFVVYKKIGYAPLDLKYIFDLE